MRNCLTMPNTRLQLTSTIGSTQRLGNGHGGLLCRHLPPTTETCTNVVRSDVLQGTQP